MTVSHLLLGIWAQEVSAGHIVMATLGFTDEKAKELAKTVSSMVESWLVGCNDFTVILFDALLLCYAD